MKIYGSYSTGCPAKGSLLKCIRARWDNIRATEGWAGLQHHALLRTSFAIYPPSRAAQKAALPPHISVNLLQGSFFTVLPSHLPDSANVLYSPEWYAGNIYDTPGPSKAMVPLPYLNSDKPTTYDLFVSGDYEVCMLTFQRCISSQLD